MPTEEREQCGPGLTQFTMKKRKGREMDRGRGSRKEGKLLAKPGFLKESVCTIFYTCLRSTP